MTNIFKAVLFSLVLAFLSGCGGGGGGGNVDITDYPFQQAYADRLTQGSRNDFTMSGKIDGLDITGSGSLLFRALASGVQFQGQDAQQQIRTFTGNFSVGGVPSLFNDVAVLYYDANLNFLGESADRTIYLQRVPPIYLTH